jgi:hypothetical protein
MSAIRAPRPLVMLCRLGIVLGLPVVSDDRVFPDDESRRARWDASRNRYVRCDDGSIATCLSLAGNGVSAILHTDGGSGGEDMTRTSTARQFADAVSSFERITGLWSPYHPSSTAMRKVGDTLYPPGDFEHSWSADTLDELAQVYHAWRKAYA